MTPPGWSSQSDEDDRPHLVVTELDGTPRHIVGGGARLSSRKSKSSTERPTADTTSLEAVRNTRDDSVVDRVADLIGDLVDQSSQDTRWTQAQLGRTQGMLDLHAALQRQGWSYNWPSHLKDGMDRAVARDTNDVGRPTKTTIGYVDRYDEQAG